jgi:thioredoxin-dependent peroxiredoxin
LPLALAPRPAGPSSRRTQLTDATDETAVLEVGDRIPDLTVESTAGPLKLSDFRGRKLVLYFYPKDSTPGCTTEGTDFAAAHARFRKAGAEIFGVSRDSLKSHANFKTKMSFPFELLSDPDETLCRQLGVMKMKNMYGRQVRGIERSTFVFDGDGRLVREWRGVKVPGHVAAVLEYVSEI